MPIYEYDCRTCGTEFDALRKFSDDDRDVECPYCLEKNSERKISLVASDGVAKGGCGPIRGPMRFG